MFTGKGIQMWGVLAGFLGVLAFILIFIACAPDHQATRTAENRREATIAARAAADTVRTIQATSVAKEKEAACLAEPTSCRRLGLDWTETVRKCQAAGYSGCNTLLSTPLPPRRPPRERPSRERPSRW